MTEDVSTLEYSVLEIPFDRIADYQGRSRLFAWSEKYFDTSLSRGAVRLRTKGFVGRIPLTSELFVQVKPRFPLANMWRVLQAASNSWERIPEGDQNYEETTDQSLQEILFVSFDRELGRILNEGFWPEYRRNTDDTTSPIGHIAFAKSMGRHWSRARDHWVTVENHKLSRDTAANRILHAAAEIVLKGATGLGLQDKSLRNVKALLVELHVQSKLRSSDFEDVSNMLRMRRWPDNRAYYVTSLRLGLQLVGAKFPALTGGPSGFLGDTAIYDMADAFENYVRNTLAARLTKHGMRVLDGDVELGRSLYGDGSGNKITPDIVFVLPDGQLRVAEVKYKPSFAANDRYQAIAYANALDAPRTILIRPAKNKADSGGYHAGNVGTDTPIELLEYKIDLAAERLELEEKLLAAWILSVL